LTPLGGYNSAEEQLQMPLVRPIVRTVPVEDEFQSHPGRRMTEQEFVQWVGEKTRAEWINGNVIVMPPLAAADPQSTSATRRQTV